MSGDPRLTDAITRLYAAALGREDWGGMLERLCAAFAGDHVVLINLDLETGQRPLVTSIGIDEKDRARLLSDEANRLAAPYFQAAPIGKAIPRGALVRDSEFARTAIYNEFLRPAGGFHSVGAIIKGPGSLMTAVNVCRGEQAKEYAAADAAAFDALLPHLLMAMEVRRRITLAEEKSAGLERLLDQLGVAAMVLDANGRPQVANARAQALLARADGLKLGNGVVAAATPAATRDLRAAVASLSMGNGGAPASLRLRLPRPSLRPALQITLLPAWRLDPEAHAAAPQSVAMLVNEPDAPPAIDREALADTFRLTAREAEIAALLADGTELGEIAEVLDLGIGTVRNHLKRVFQKTGVGSQAALVALARGFVRI